MRTKARIRYRKQERIHRQANERVRDSLSADQRRILTLSQDEYTSEEIARELALPREYVEHFMSGMVRRLSQEGLIGAPEWRNVLRWAEEQHVMERGIFPPASSGDMA